MDEVVIVCRDRSEVVDTITKMLYDSIDEVSDEFMLRRRLGCDIQTGYRYSEIH